MATPPRNDQSATRAPVTSLEVSSTGAANVQKRRAERVDGLGHLGTWLYYVMSDLGTIIDRMFSSSTCG
jgi:hypothetical protein